MAEAKLIVMYPWPEDPDDFERVYQQEHMPIAEAQIPNKTKMLSTRITGSGTGETPEFYRIAQLHFPSLAALQEAADSEGGKAALEHAFEISTGGPPVVMIAEEEVIEF